MVGSAQTRRRRSSSGRLWPPKYYTGLSARAATRRRKEILKFGKKSWRDPSAYTGFATDVGVKTKPSQYTRKWKSMFPNATSLEEKAKASGVPLSAIQKSYDRGLAAWRTGHRPGATQGAWGHARVHSFLLCGKTHYSTDADLVREAKRTSASARAWFKKQRC